MKTLQDLHQRRKKLGKRVQKRRLELNKTLQEVAEQVQLPAKHLDQIEKGLMSVDAATEFMDISHALNTPVEKLLPEE